MSPAHSVIQHGLLTSGRCLKHTNFLCLVRIGSLQIYKCLVLHHYYLVKCDVCQRFIYSSKVLLKKTLYWISYWASPEQHGKGRTQLARLHLDSLARRDFWGETVEWWPWLWAIIVFLCENATSMRAGRLWVEACKMHSSKYPGSLLVSFHVTWFATGYLEIQFINFYWKHQ